eukprot:13217570-Alexandrium_andersonii.AAC.1
MAKKFYMHSWPASWRALGTTERARLRAAESPALARVTASVFGVPASSSRSRRVLDLTYRSRRLVWS